MNKKPLGEISLNIPGHIDLPGKSACQAPVPKKKKTPKNNKVI